MPWIQSEFQYCSDPRLTRPTVNARRAWLSRLKLAHLLLPLCAILPTPATAAVVAGAHYSDSFTVDPTSFSCGYYGTGLICGSYGIVHNGPRYYQPVDTQTVDVTYTSPVSVPGSSVFNILYVALDDIKFPGGFAFPGPNHANITSVIHDYVGPSNPFVGPYSPSYLHAYVASAGFVGVSNDGFSATGMTSNFEIVNGDPDPVWVATFGYAAILDATPAVLASFAGGTVDHPAILPAGLTGEVSSAISGGVAASEQFYGFQWNGGLFQTVGSIVGANPLADFHFQLLDPYSLAVVGNNDLLLDATNNFSATMTYNLAPGIYEIGMYTDSPYDPQFTIHFNTPVSGIVPEPDSWAMMLLGFGAIGFASRRRRTQAQLG